MVDTIQIIEKYYKKDCELYNILIQHSLDVMNKAVSIAEAHKDYNIDIEFIKEAAMLHDIGINLTYAPGIKCYGVMPYLCHGYLGREILEEEGLPRHALVCERHAGIGLTVDDIKRLSLPLPLRDMVPQTIEEELICFSDCFFSKTKIGREKSIEKITSEIRNYAGEYGVNKFNAWCDKFL